jgi:hypothetical protein
VKAAGPEAQALAQAEAEAQPQPGVATPHLAEFHRNLAEPSLHVAQP